jgi:predicted DNA-binding transcriptional regulator YafY
MHRSTQFAKACRLNAAFHLIARGHTPVAAADALTERFALSRRQAYRYLQQARKMTTPLPVCEPSIAITIKVPADVAAELRAFAATSGMSIGETVARAVRAFLTETDSHG